MIRPLSTSPHHGVDVRRPLACATALALAVVLAGCGLLGDDRGAAVPKPTSTTSSTTSTTDPPVAHSEPPTVLDAGAEPRHELRMRFTEGQESTVTFTSDLEVDQDTGTRTQGIDSPPITQELRYTVGDVTAEGAQVSVRIADLSVRSKGTGLDEDAVERLEEQLEPMIGTVGAGRLTTLGEWEGLTFDLPADISDPVRSHVEALGAQLGSLGPSLPSEPVGIGARWTSTSTSGAADAPTETASTYTVTELTPDELSYTATSTTTAKPHGLTTPGLAKGTTATLRSSELVGTTTGSMALDRPGYALRTSVEGTQTLVLTTAKGDTTVTQQVRLAYVAETHAA